MAEVDSFANRIAGPMLRLMALAVGHRNELALPVLTLAEDARAVLTELSRQMERAQAQGEVFEDVRAFARKTAEHAAWLAAVMALVADSEAAIVTGETMAVAVALARFYADEAARLQNASVIQAYVQDAERMRKWLLGTWSEDFISPPVAIRLGPFKLTERAQKALKLLEAHGWLVQADGATVDGKQLREAWRVLRS